MFSKITAALTATYFLIAYIVITPVLAADLFFYRDSDGLGAVAHIAGGTLQQTQSIQGMTLGWSEIVSTS